MSSESREFQVFVKPVGARCNLRCSYCYYSGHSHPGRESGGQRMSDKVLERYIRQHIQAAGGGELFFSWHGGEPALAGIEFYRRAVALEKKYAPPECRMVNGIQTNATLLDDEWGRFLSEEGFYVGVSLDGPERFHDSSRLRAYGRGTFADVMRGVEILRRHRVPHEVLCVVSNNNVHAPLEVYRFLRDLGIEFVTFLPLVERKSRNSSEVTARSAGAAAFGRFLAEIFDEWIANDIGKIKVQIFEEALRTAFGQEHTLCIFKPVCGAVPAVEMNGDFYSCDHFVDGEHLIGNIMNRSLESLLDDPRQKAFGEAKKTTLPRYCLDCEVLDMCNGECLRNRFISAPDGEPGLNYLCDGYRYFFNHCRPFINEVARLWRKGS
ncbi:MAG TPA: anaerobic sulfatase maturase [Bacteroidales bacterium]|nr:anaerobic sulfatase maturase [Bacteroidales bacterium]HNV65753.1 anaerobic sulfatase maturase [Bacteroidales bacterium]HPK84744.1 anaerobic sulfatase maturase [Bacteroidales bacterium]HPO40138.1 anaerobic sulfatase maturase [Bacteroidales bacterium]HPV26147.1 anaerobic sulfatase maturase [Bacteroidales bacterium]